MLIKHALFGKVWYPVISMEEDVGIQPSISFQNWAKKHIAGFELKMIKWTGPELSWITIKFENEEDACLFKLKWCNNA